jgi:hypothetical protein
MTRPFPQHRMCLYPEGIPPPCKCPFFQDKAGQTKRGPPSHQPEGMLDTVLSIEKKPKHFALAQTTLEYWSTNPRLA